MRSSAPADPRPAVVRLDRVCKHYARAAGAPAALSDISLQVRQGECLALVGHSGSGKSTLIHLLAGIDTPSSGEIHVQGAAVHALSQDRLTRWRGRQVGVVFQFFQLLPTLTALENVMLPMDFCGSVPARERRPRGLALLARVGVAAQAAKLPADMSGGQQQRVAIARALANDPALILADEPTGNLDSATAEGILGLFAELAAEGKTVIAATHERDFGRFFGRSLRLVDGRLAEGGA